MENKEDNNKKKVLLIEDSFGGKISELESKLSNLSKYDINLRISENADDAYNLIQDKNKYDLIITDLGLPSERDSDFLKKHYENVEKGTKNFIKKEGLSNPDDFSDKYLERSEVIEYPGYLRSFLKYHANKDEYDPEYFNELIQSGIGATLALEAKVNKMPVSVFTSRDHMTGGLMISELVGLINREQIRDIYSKFGFYKDDRGTYGDLEEKRGSLQNSGILYCGDKSNLNHFKKVIDDSVEKLGKK